VAQTHRHAHTFVEARGAGRVLGVDPERDAATPAGVQVVEGLTEQRLAETVPAPRPSHAEDGDPGRPKTLLLADLGRRGRAVFGPNEVAEAPLERPVLPEPLLERALHVAPVILESLLERLVEHVRFTRLERDAEARGPVRLGRRLVEVDGHAVE